MSTWDQKLLTPASAATPVLRQVYDLFDQQRATWGLFRNGEAMLAEMKTREFAADNARLMVQANPGRTRSTNAKVDPASVAKRPCFLCPENLPAEERGIAFGDYVMLPNPYPVLKHHMTIALKSHQPQSLAGRINDLCALTKALGPELFVIYNGPRCGASAPDHMHFQACSSKDVPLFTELQIPPVNDRVVPVTSWGRHMVIGSFRKAQQARKRIKSIISTLKELTGDSSEPMFNIAGLYRDDRYVLCLFPRARHRSACYFDEPQRQIAISPAALEMAGIIVVSNIDHFDRVDEGALLSMFKEVSLEKDIFSRLTEVVT